MKALLPILLIAATANTFAASIRFERHEIASFPVPYQLAVADMNGDGKPDLVVSDGKNNKLLWFENRGKN